MVPEFLLTYLTTPANLILLIVAWDLALIVLYAWKATSKAWLIYIHLALLLTPLVHLGTTIQCDITFIPALLSFCGNYFTKLTLLTLPFTLLGSILLGYFALPFLYIQRCNAKQHCVSSMNSAAHQAGMKTPPLFIFDQQEPQAFTIHGNVFASVGLFDLLTKKEQEAVFLHELGHIKTGSNWRKFSVLLLKVFSPLAAFTPLHTHHSKEEENADAFARTIHGTTRHLFNAKRKFHLFKQEKILHNP